MARILVADDEAAVRAGLVAMCMAAGHRCAEAGTGVQALARAREDGPEVVLLDLRMPDGGGLDVLPALVALPHAPSVIVLTGYVDVRTAVRAMQEGAANVLEKPVDPPTLRKALERVLEGRLVRAERDRLRDEVAHLRSGPIVGRSAAIRTVLEHVERVAATPQSTVLVIGDSGVGKELIARAIHERSGRAQGPFVALNCAALSEGLLEAELFGYEPGSFTGGDPRGRDGLLAAAKGGTLLLDEIGELDVALQAKLLRVLQERVYRRVGGTRDLPMDVRVVGATNRDLNTAVEHGRFREDLFYRLNVLSIVVPPLRERPEDVPGLALHFLERFASELGRHFTGISDNALEVLMRYPWPGNVRELRNAIERAAILASEGEIRPEHIALDERPRALANPVGALTAARPEDLRIDRMEATLIRRALELHDGNKQKAAESLGIHRSTLYKKLETYEIPER
ncbi:MAG: sigma-54 dependent transcriptional regulator [Planctomycetota bacterium]